MFSDKIPDRKSGYALMEIKYSANIIESDKKPIKNTSSVLNFLILFIFFLPDNTSPCSTAIRNKEKAVNSKIATIFVMKETERRKPEIKMYLNLFFFINLSRKIAESIIGRCIKFSAFAIFPSTIGLPKRTTYKMVAI